eukprot:scaffold1913_cov257-Pinguiococcus_pyrenoidosus.AAC.28
MRRCVLSILRPQVTLRRRRPWETLRTLASRQDDDGNGQVILDFDPMDEIRASRRTSARQEKLRENLSVAMLGKRRSSQLQSDFGKKRGHVREVLAHRLRECLEQVVEEGRVDLTGLTDPRSAMDDPVQFTRVKLSKDKRDATVYWVLPSAEEQYSRLVQDETRAPNLELHPNVLAKLEKLPKSPLERQIDLQLRRRTAEIRHQLFLLQRLKVVPKIEFRRDEQKLKAMAFDVSLSRLEREAAQADAAATEAGERE